MESSETKVRPRLGFIDPDGNKLRFGSPLRR